MHGETLDTNDFQSVLRGAQQLSLRDKQRLIEYLLSETTTPDTIKPLALRGRWKGIELTQEEIDQARTECWKGLGE